jgi:ABC-2 type transport system permease protein
MLVPAATASVYYLVFKLILKIQIENYVAFVFSGIIFWGYFSQSVLESMESIVGNQGLLTKVPVPPQSFPLVVVSTQTINAVLAFPVLFGVIFLTTGSFGVTSLYSVFYLLLTGVMALSLGGMLAVFYVYLRDLRHLVGIIFQLWMYATPVLYSDDLIPKDFRWVLNLNPVSYIFIGIHKALVLQTAPSLNEILVPLVWTSVVFLLYWIVLSKFRHKLVERL